MFFFAFVILAAAGSTPCVQTRVAVTRGHLDVFVDPSPQTRAEVTKRLIKTVLRPAQKTPTKISCVSDAVSDLLTFADPALLSPALRDFRFAVPPSVALQDTSGGLQSAPSNSLRDPDPRAWHPRDVALVIARAREDRCARVRERPIEITSDEKIIDAPVVSGTA